MNTSARMKTRALVLLSVYPIGAPAGRWSRIVKTMERIRLLSTSPIASWRWAMAKRKARIDSAAVEQQDARVAEIRALPVIPGG
jgi:hypothetical protein